MGLSYGGEINMAAATPVTAAAIGPAIADLQAQLTGAISLRASLNVSPPTSLEIIANLQAFIAQLQVAGNLGLPNVNFDLAACASLIATLQGAILNLNLLNNLLVGAGVFAYLYTGDAASLGAAITSEFLTQYRDGEPSTTAGTFIILGAHATASESVLTLFFSGV